MVDNTTAIEDEEYRQGYWNFGYEPAAWSVDTLSSWLHWDDEYQGALWHSQQQPCRAMDVLITLDDGKGHEDVHEFTINVINTLRT